MARIIPNENTHVRFCSSIASAALVPTADEVAAGINVTPFLISLNASSQGNVVPTPSFDTLFETSISGTVQATFTADFYRDSTSDTAWDELSRGTSGYFVISRFGGTGTDKIPQAGNTVEVWPVRITARTMQNMANNTVMTFSVTGSVPSEPNEAATIPNVPAIMAAPTGVAGDTKVTLSWAAPSDGGSPITGYKVYAYSEVDSYAVSIGDIGNGGLTADYTGITNGVNYKFKTTATNAIGESVQSPFSAIFTPTA